MDTSEQHNNPNKFYTAHTQTHTQKNTHTSCGLVHGEVDRIK